MRIALSTYMMADNIPFSHTSNLFDASNTNTLGLSVAPGTETITVFAPTDNTDHFSNGIVMISFKGTLYCMWQSSKTDEDASDTWVAYSRSTDDGKTWSNPMVIAETISNGYCSSGGWHATADTLVAYINKSMVYNDYLYVAYATNKEDVQYTRVPLSSISLNGGLSGISTTTNNDCIVFATGNQLHIQLAKVSNINVEIFSITGNKVAQFTEYGNNITYNMKGIPTDMYIVRTLSIQGVTSDVLVIK